MNRTPPAQRIRTRIAETFKAKAQRQPEIAEVWDEHQRFDRGSPAAPASPAAKVQRARGEVRARSVKLGEMAQMPGLSRPPSATASKRLGEAGSGVSLRLAINCA